MKDSVVSKYYFAGAQRIAMRTNGTLSYMTGDHLGSTSLTTDASGNLISELRYKPWGETRYVNGTTPIDYKYTGQREVVSLGLYFYNARWYDPALGRFAQADSIVAGGYQASAQSLQGVADSMYTALAVSYSEQPVIAKLNADNSFMQGHGGSLMNVKEEDKRKAKIAGVPLNVQALDRFVYSLNDPIKYSDPSGHYTFEFFLSFGDWDDIYHILLGMTLTGPLVDNAKSGEYWGTGVGAFIGYIATELICASNLLCGAFVVGISAVGGLAAGDELGSALRDELAAVLVWINRNAMYDKDQGMGGFIIYLTHDDDTPYDFTGTFYIAMYGPNGYERIQISYDLYRLLMETFLHKG